MRRSASITAKAVAFFKKHAGYAQRSGETAAQAKTRGAKSLARAEAEASARGWRYKWEDEIEADLSLEDESDISEVLMVALYDEHGNVLLSLGSVTLGHDSAANRAYKRVIEAELADEALGEKRS